MIAVRKHDVKKTFTITDMLVLCGEWCIVLGALRWICIGERPVTLLEYLPMLFMDAGTGLVLWLLASVGLVLGSAVAAFKMCLQPKVLYSFVALQMLIFGLQCAYVFMPRFDDIRACVGLAAILVLVHLETKARGLNSGWAIIANGAALLALGGLYLMRAAELAMKSG